MPFGHPLDRISNVQWGGGGVVLTVDHGSNVFYLRTTGKLVWRNLGKLGFATGAIHGSAHGLVGGKYSVFVLVGGGAVGTILASQDGLKWKKVFTFVNPEPAQANLGATIFGVVWDGSAFWAGGNHFNQYGPPEFEATETDVLFYSKNGYDWERLESHVSTFFGSDPGAAWPEYKKGLLAAHCSKTVFDQFANGVPGGVYGQNEQLRIAPAKPPSIMYLEGDMTYQPDSDNLVITKFGPGIEEVPPKSGMYAVYGVAETGGIWVTAGGRFGGVYTPAAAILVRTKDGLEWKRITPSGAVGPLITICGGQVKLKPEG